MQLFKIFKSFLKIGVIGFGGGSALIPVIEKEIVENSKAMDVERYRAHTVVANITPGALPVKLGALSGYDMGGLWGMLLGATAIAFPGTLLTVLLISLLSGADTTILTTIEYASVGISVFIIFLLWKYIKKTQIESCRNNFSKQSILLMVTTVVLSFGKEIRALGKLLFEEVEIFNAPPIFDIATIDLLILAFFIILFTGGKYRRNRTIFATVASLIFVLASGKTKFIDLGAFLNLYKAGYLMIAIAFLIKDFKNENAGLTKIKLDYSKAIKGSLAFILPLVAVIAITYFSCNDAVHYMLNGIVSTVTSFGGGEAYMTVADGIFVGGGFVTASDFYGKIVPIANALPGPILVKILAAIGFFIGESSGTAAAYLMSLLGFTTALAATCVTCLFVNLVYEAFSQTSIFRILKMWILPIISGLLVTTMLTMVIEILKICLSAQMVAPLTLVFIFLLLLAVNLFHYKFKLHDVANIILLGSISTVVLLLLR